MSLLLSQLLAPSSARQDEEEMLLGQLCYCSQTATLPYCDKLKPPELPQAMTKLENTSTHLRGHSNDIGIQGEEWVYGDKITGVK